MAEPPYTFIPDLAAEVTIPEKGILSRTLQNDDRTKVVLFAFAAGEELSEHTASMPAVLHFLAGEGELTLGHDRMPARPGGFAHMPANLPHAIRARSGLLMLLVLVKGSIAAP
jgi:quercetin dioxygenase-like cupin family protein